MALYVNDKRRKQQIEAGTKGRLKGHQFEEDVTNELNNLRLGEFDYSINLKTPNVYQGNPAVALVEHISKDKKQQIVQLKVYWLGGLATAGAGAELKNEDGEIITGSKSDVVVDVTYSGGVRESIGVSVKSCGNNAQVALTTSTTFCEMLRANNIPVSEEAEIGLKMFCGESGYSPKDGYIPADVSNIPSPRGARPERWYWEELSTTVQKEWSKIFTDYQDQITILIMQKANAYKTDSFKPSYILHECSNHTTIQNCEVAVMSMEEFAEYSRLFDSFGIKKQSIRKGRYKGIDLAIHQYPHFGFIQFQPIGNKQNFSELQFNIKANYYKTFTKLREKKDRSND